MTVYVVTAGAYSDYHICGLTLDKEKAEHLCMLYGFYNNDAEVEEWETDKFTGLEDIMDYIRHKYIDEEREEENKLKPYAACFDPWSGVFLGFGNTSSSSSISDIITVNGLKREATCMPPIELGSADMIMVYAEDEEHARKIACDKYAKQKAEKEGI